MDVAEARGREGGGEVEEGEDVAGGEGGGVVEEWDGFGIAGRFWSVGEEWHGQGGGTSVDKSGGEGGGSCK